MNETQQNTPAKQNPLKTLMPYGVSLVLIIVAMAVMSFLFPSDSGNTLDPAISLSTMVILFILGMLLKANYTSKLFIVTLVLGLFLASLTTFTQALLTIMVVLVVQKLLQFI